MGEIERRDRRLADIGVDMSGKRPEPGLDGVDRLDHAGEVAALDDLLGEPQLLVGETWIFVPDSQRRRHIGFADKIGAEILQRGVGVERLVMGVGVDQHRRLIGHHLLEDREDRFALGEPLPADAGQNLRRVALVERDRPRRPAIGKGETIELVENPGIGR